jgi:predicted component of type VI protein secretion system
MPKLTLVLERKPVQVYDVGSFVTNIGRAEDMHIVIDNVSVSRRQAQIRLQDDGSWAVQDLGSSNGTFLNGQRLTGAERLKRGDEISFGKYSLFFESAIAEPVGEAEPAWNGKTGEVSETFYMNAEDVERLQHAVALKRRAQLQWEARGKSGTFYLDGPAALVGQSILCDARVPAGPKHHLLVTRNKFGFEIRNLSRWRRMRVNGWVLAQSLLRSGDTVEIGGLRLKFLDDLTPQAAHRPTAAEPAESLKGQAARGRPGE